ncbi:restriction endonuclease subunit S [Halochromatium roseum]|uniref:restriction endonuclease subunit S n=1 Tax=Halochromatium roseum TaxID=391920 RepID=UPI0019122356|nr:restriction endonuclease subunit S [Halochromatium roseum]MBK5940661.1 hypothetical protein [Halochromatium roseum]
MSSDSDRPALHLPTRYLAIVQDILRRYLPHAEVWAYGSRVNGDHYDASDLDLVVRQPDDLSRRQPDLDEIAAAFSDSDLPILVQIVDWARIPEAFREEIEAGYVVIRHADSAPAAPEDEDVGSHPNLLPNPVWELGSGSAISRAGTTRKKRAATDDWKTMTLEEAGVRLHDCLHKTPAEVQDGAYRYIAIPQMSRGRLDFSSARRISESDFLEWTLKANPQAHDVVLSRRCNPGETSYVSPGETFALGQNLVLLRADGSSVYPPFLRWLVRGPQWWEQIRTYLNVGAVFDSLKCRDVPQFEFHIPPLREQRAIAAVLGALDDKIEQNRRTAQALERLARAIFRAWFVDFEPVKAKAAGSTAFPSMPQPVFDALPTCFVDSDIGPVPEGLEAAALSSVSTLVSGGTPKRSEPAYWGGDVPWYSVKDAPSDGEIWVFDTSERITDDGLLNSAARMVPKGCTIISARGTVGKLAMAGSPMAFNQSCYGLLPGDDASFCHLYLLMQTAVANLKQRTHGSVFDTITRATFDGLLVAKPAGEIVSAFEAVVAPIFDLLLASLQESSKIADLRDYLLPKLLSGELRVKEAERVLETTP